MLKFLAKLARRPSAIAFPMAIAFSGCTFAVYAQTYEVINGGAILTREGRLYKAERGVALIENDYLRVPNRLEFLGAYNSFIANQTEGHLHLTVLRRGKSGEVFQLITYLGQLNLVVGHRRNPKSTLRARSFKTGEVFTFWGTKANLLDVKDCSAIAVTQGTVETSNVGQSVFVEGGYGNIGCKDAAPGQPFRLDNSLGLKSVRFEQTAVGLLITAKINPLHKLIVDGISFVPKINGTVEARFSQKEGNSLKLSVTDSDGITRSFYKPLARHN
jgi:hypothetical protein